MTATASSVEALKLFSANPTGFGLIITDQAMPELPGTRLAEKITKIRANIPIILCTGHSDTVNKESAKKHGIPEFLMKPLAKQELTEAVRRVLDVETGKQR